MLILYIGPQYKRPLSIKDNLDLSGSTLLYYLYCIWDQLVHLDGFLGLVRIPLPTLFTHRAVKNGDYHLLSGGSLDWSHQEVLFLDSHLALVRGCAGVDKLWGMRATPDLDRFLAPLTEPYAAQYHSK